MKYGKDYNARMLTEFQQQIATELIARELCGPSHHNAWGSYVDTDYPELQEAAKRILYQPEDMGGRYLSIRADAIHASFGIMRLFMDATSKGTTKRAGMEWRISSYALTSQNEPRLREHIPPDHRCWIESASTGPRINILVQIGSPNTTDDQAALLMAHMARGLNESNAVEILSEALKPFAEYGNSNRKFPRGGQITHGSSMAKKQLTMGNCYDAADALKAIEP